MTITLRQIRGFLAVCEYGSFTRAAARLNMAQPALSQLIRELEGDLGIRVLDRTTRRLEMTEGGREFQSAAQQILQDVEAAVQNARGLAECRRGRIVVAAPPLLAAVVLPPAITALHDNYPGLHVGILDARNDLVVEAVRSGAADCGIGTFSTHEDGVERRPLARDSLMLFCRADSPFARQRAIVWQMLEAEALVTLTRESGIRLLVEVGYESAQIPLRPAYEVAQITTALALVGAGLGVAVLPTYARAFTSEPVVARPLTSPSITRDIVLIRPSGRAIPPALSVFHVLLKRFVNQLAPSETCSGATNCASGN